MRRSNKYSGANQKGTIPLSALKLFSVSSNLNIFLKAIANIRKMFYNILGLWSTVIMYLDAPAPFAIIYFLRVASPPRRCRSDLL